MTTAKLVILTIGILFSTTSFGQNTEAKKIAELYLKMLVNVDGNSEMAYKKYLLPVDQQEGYGSVLDFLSFTNSLFTQSVDELIHLDVEKSIPKNSSKIAEKAIYYAIYNTIKKNTIGYDEDKELQTSMVNLKNAIVTFFKSATYKITNIKIHIDESDEFKNESKNQKNELVLAADVYYEISIPTIEYKNLPIFKACNSNQEKLDYFNLLALQIKKGTNATNKNIVKEKFIMHKFKIKNQSFWITSEVAKIIDPLFEAIIPVH